jgi:hypothetical protein
MSVIDYPIRGRLSNIEELLDLVERGTARLMRCGGLVDNSCGIANPNPNMGRPLDPATKQQIVDCFLWQQANGKVNLRAIADSCGVHYQTVAVHTRDMRTGKRVVNNSVSC